MMATGPPRGRKKSRQAKESHPEIENKIYTPTPAYSSVSQRVVPGTPSRSPGMCVKNADSSALLQMPG